ncbi:unnamed protein product [Peniophora sp. CBMAI 1063]|nr:unnamed protein product [Peniophora sp. CBMAI 1063]
MVVQIPNYLLPDDERWDFLHALVADMRDFVPNPQAWPKTPLSEKDASAVLRATANFILSRIPDAPPVQSPPPSPSPSPAPSVISDDDSESLSVARDSRDPADYIHPVDGDDSDIDELNEWPLPSEIVLRNLPVLDMYQWEGSELEAIWEAYSDEFSAKRAFTAVAPHSGNVWEIPASHRREEMYIVRSPAMQWGIFLRRLCSPTARRSAFANFIPPNPHLPAARVCFSHWPVPCWWL